MSTVKLAFIGAGSIRCAAPVIATLATYFGERQLEIALYDADEERLDLFDRFARTAFILMKSTHGLRSTSLLEEAIENADAVLVGYDENCARREIGIAARKMTTAETMSAMADRVLELAPPNCAMMSLPYSGRIEGSTDTDGWPDTPEQASWVVPLQILRWLNGEEYPYDLFRENERSPLRAWLDDPQPRRITS
jgi:hypothetical protein